MVSGIGPSAELALNALPAVFWGVALAIACRHPASRFLERPGAAVSGLMLGIACTAWVWRHGSSGFAETLAGLGLMAVALGSAGTARPGRLARLGPLAYGIYLSHLLFIKVFEAAAARFGSEVGWAQSVSVFLASAAAATLLAWSLSRWRGTRWLVA
jgi:peptidoglycan/LPS O-acetylase OafA/YrhL